MFNLSTQEVVLSIENTPLVNLDGKYFQEYQNFFGKNFNFPDITKSKFKKLTNQEHLARQILDADDIQLKKLQIFFMNKQITNALEKKYELDLKFDSVDVWQDLPVYYLTPHTDNESIKVAVQIYLSNHDQGTCMYDDKGEIVHVFPFKNNFGYSLLNNENSLHGVPEINKDGRISLYVRYS